MLKSKNVAPFESALIELMQTKHGRRVFLAAMPVLLFACASSNKSQTSDEITPAYEQLLAKEAAQEIRRDYRALQDIEIQEYVADVGRRLVAKNNLASNPYNYTFTVVEARSINAFALPAGTVFVTRPLLASTESEAELAGVLGHEIGHVKARHAAERMMAQKKSKEQSIWYGTGGALVGGAVGLGVSSAVCGKSSNFCVAQLVWLATMAGVQGGLLIQKYRFLLNSQENELEADRLGFAFATRAGYSSAHVGDFYARTQRMVLQKQQNKIEIAPSFFDAMTTHPPSVERVKQIEDLVSRTKQNSQSVVSTIAFEKIKKKSELFNQ